MKDIFQAYLRYYEELAPDNVENLRNLASPALHFVDPFNDTREIEHVILIFKRMFKKLKDPEFQILDAVGEGDKLLVRWRMSFSSIFLHFGRAHTITGVSVITLGADNKIAEHIDYWDAASQLYLHLPLVGIFIRLLRKVFA